MEYSLKNKSLEVTIDSFGAQIVSLKAFGKEREWQNSDGSWDGHAPILFPVCGKCSVIIDKVTYDMPPHGFALNSEFELLSRASNKIEFLLKSNENTKKFYPYFFEFIVTYRIHKNKLIVKYKTHNLSDKEMYFSCGAHDSFVVGKHIEDYRVLFNKKENLILFYDDDGILTDNSVDMGFKNNFKIIDSGLKDDVSLILKNIRSTCVSLLDNNNKKIVVVGFKGFSNFVFWRSQNNDMICIEPWLNLPDKIDGCDIPFSDKLGIKRIKPNGYCLLKRYIKYFL